MLENNSTQSHGSVRVKDKGSMSSLARFRLMCMLFEDHQLQTVPG